MCGPIFAGLGEGILVTGTLQFVIVLAVARSPGQVHRGAQSGPGHKPDTVITPISDLMHDIQLKSRIPTSKARTCERCPACIIESPVKVNFKSASD